MNTLLGFPESSATPAFGRLLKQWRNSRHKSQLALATESGISTRHLSFLETGRAQPSREMVQLLTGMLDVPLGERNALLVSAGYAPLYGNRPLNAPELGPVRRALELMLRQQEPYPAFVLDGQWNIVMHNAALKRVFEPFKTGTYTPNVMRKVFDPDALRPFIVNWHEIAACTMHSLHRELAATGSAALVELRDELLAYPGVPRAMAGARRRVCRRSAGGDAASARRCLDGVLLDDHPVRHAARRHAAAVEDRVFLPRRLRHRAALAPPRRAGNHRRLAPAASRASAITSRVIASVDPSRENGIELTMLIHAIAIAVILQMNNVAQAPTGHLERAQQEVIRLYHNIGVDVAWPDRRVARDAGARHSGRTGSV
jgi:transcriptional regulator with XRE-family HTH domain